nr:hypothetical protein CFP56_65399 [Quercus suber]
MYIARCLINGRLSNQGTAQRAPRVIWQSRIFSRFSYELMVNYSTQLLAQLHSCFKSFGFNFQFSQWSLDSFAHSCHYRSTVITTDNNNYTCFLHNRENGSIHVHRVHGSMGRRPLLGSTLIRNIVSNICSFEIFNV